MSNGNTFNLPFGEEVSYWKTGQSDADTWIAKAKKKIEEVGGEVEAEGFGSDAKSGHSAFMLSFFLEGERFKIVWPVLPSKQENVLAARRQAATMIYHDVKAKCISAQVLGVRMAFFCYLELPDGRLMGQIATASIFDEVPKNLLEG